MSILVVGALHHDVIVQTPAIPRVDETLPGKSVNYAFGGKGGNQAVQAGRLGKHFGVPVAMVGCVGRDAPGDLMLETLAQAGVETGQVQRVDEPTGMSVALSLPDGSYAAVIVSSSNFQLDYQQVCVDSNTGWVVLQNELQEVANSAFAQSAKGMGAKVLLNAAPARAMSDALLANVDLLVVNQVEATDLLAVDLLAGDEGIFQPVQGAEKLQAHFNCDVIVTLGSDGLVIASTAGTAFSPACPVQVVSTHGAGDAFIGALAVMLASGAALAEAARFASAAAALHVSTPIEEREKISLEAIKALAQLSS